MSFCNNEPTFVNKPFEQLACQACHGAVRCPADGEKRGELLSSWLQSASSAAVALVRGELAGGSSAGSKWRGLSASDRTGTMLKLAIELALA